ncbi:MAG: hypothetical protein J6V88_01945 [Kiritimatiellae bacterium]|nr:hypothetical protein [Kiritimatiellia bacterium]
MKKSLLIFLSILAASSIATTFRRSLERVASMDPLRSTSLCDVTAIALVYEPLLSVDYYHTPYKLTSALCDLPVISDDGLTYTFKIKSDSYFHANECFKDGKGRKVVADDIVYSLKRLGDKKNASSGMWIMNCVTNVHAIDERTVEINLSKPSHIFPWLMALPYTGVTPREAVEKYKGSFGSNPVGSGPYKLTSWRRNHTMNFSRNEDWPGWNNERSFSFDNTTGKKSSGKLFEKVTYSVIDDVTTQWLMFLSGEIDYLATVPRDNWDAVIGKDGKLLPSVAKKGIVLHENPTLTAMYIGINMEDPLLGKNKKLRQALNCAFDFNAWNKFFNNRISPLDSPLPEGVPGKVNGEFKYSYNPEKAKQLLKEAGYENGIDPKTSRRLVIHVAVGRATQDAREQMELFQSFYDRIGINIEPDYMTWDAYLKAINEKRVSMFLIGWVGDYPDAENFLQLFYSKNISPGSNHSNYSNPEFDRIYNRAMGERDEKARNVLWAQAQRIILEDCPWIFLHTPKNCSLIRKKINGYQAGDFVYGMEKHLRLSDD